MDGPEVIPALKDLAAHTELLNELHTSPKPLKHVSDTHDKSAPIIDPGLRLSKFPHDELMAEVQHGAKLAHVQPTDIHDTSSPRITGSVVCASPKKVAELMEQVKEGGVALKHVDTRDKSGPFIPADAHLEVDQHPALLKEVLHHKPLVHVDETLRHDATAAGPHIAPGTPCLDPAGDPHKALMEEVKHSGGTAALHHVDPAVVHDHTVLDGKTA